MPVLTEEQKRFLEAVDITDRVHAGCSHQECHDHLHVAEIEVATALATYGISGEQMACVVMDMASQAMKLAEQRPDLARPSGLVQFIRQSAVIAALAYRQHRDGSPGA